MARVGARRGGGGLFRNLERLGVTRGVFGGSRGWFYVGTGLWTVRKLRTLAAREPEILLRETLRPGDRVVIANGVATIQSQEQVAAAGDRPRSRRARKRARRADRRALVTQADLRRRSRRRAS